ncbi:MAG: DUF2800 domain-containing protein [Gammaproteobacteria bacterium]|nr:DUF2800 domain-containing protein [Gammaproteobacteria bacterium]
MPGQHAYFAPSASPRWLACPGSLALSEGIKETTSSYAHEGAVCHEVAARCLKENLTADDFSGETIDGVFLEADLIEGIQMYVDEVRGQTKELGVKGGKIEHTVNVTEDCWGTLDAMLWNDEWLLIDDLKMGKGVIVEADTPQMKVYAVGAMKWLQVEHGLIPQKIKTVIIQPRTVNPIRPAEYDRAELIEWYKKTLMPTMEAVKNGAVKCVPGETQCRWCPAGVCTAQADFAIREASQAFKPFTEQDTPEVPIPTESPTLDFGAMAKLKKSFKFIEDWMKTINAKVMEAALKGEQIPGFKLVEGRSNRKWKVDESRIIRLLTSHNIEPHEKTLKTGPAVEKEMGKKKAKAIKLENYMHKPPGSPTLADESDKRPVMSINVEKEFEDFVESGPVVVETATGGSPETDEFGDEIKPYTLMQRLAMQDIEDDPQVSEPDPLTDPELAAAVDMFAVVAPNAIEAAEELDLGPGEIVSSPRNEVGIVQSAVPNPEPVEPKSSTKRHQVLLMGKVRVSLEEVAKELNCGVNSVKMHIRYLHERDGYGYELYSDETFKIIV